jgi:hypothetical protein
LTKIILYKKYLFIYHSFKQKLVKGQLERVEIPLDTSSAPLSPKLFILKKKLKKNSKTNQLFLKIISSLK